MNEDIDGGYPAAAFPVGWSSEGESGRSGYSCAGIRRDESKSDTALLSKRGSAGLSVRLLEDSERVYA